MLFFILSARRNEALFAINIDNIITANNKVFILPNKTLNHANLNRPLEQLTYHKYEAEESSWIVQKIYSFQVFIYLDIPCIPVKKPL